MAATKGNQFWKARVKHGRDKTFKTPELMLEAAFDYFNWVEDNPLTKATISRSLFVREDAGTVTIYPSPSASTYNMNSTAGASTLNNDTEQFEVSYYKKPTKPSWGYIVVNDKALYNINTSVNFELHACEEEPLVSRILMLAGLTIKQPDVQQAGGSAIAATKQLQNS